MVSVSRADWVLLACIVVALPTAYAVDAATGDETLAFLSLNAVGVGLPALYRLYLSRERDGSTGA